MTHLPALVTLLSVLLMVWTVLWVARARGRYGVKAPATTGPVEFERVFRVQMNTLESVVMFLPCLWVAAHYGNPTWAGLLGLVYIAARIVYALAYASGARRGFGFATGGAVTAVLLVWGLVEVAIAMARGA